MLEPGLSVACAPAQAGHTALSALSALIFLTMSTHTPPRLFLIDGYALIYRAFFAMISRPLRTTKGENTSAAWGVVNFLLRLREKYRPDYVCWVNDAGTSFREERYPDYKSTREKLDDSLQADFDRAVERIGALLEGFRIPLVTVPGYEADDVIGTLARAGAERGLQLGHRLGRQGLLSAHRARASPCSTPAGVVRPRWTRSGWTSPTPPSGSACRHGRWWTSWRSSATARTTSRE